MPVRTRAAFFDRVGADARAPDELLSLHRGQGMDLFWRDNLRCPTEQEYLAMVSNSTCAARARRAPAAC